MVINSSNLAVGAAMLAIATLVLTLVGLAAWLQRGSGDADPDDGGVVSAVSEPSSHTPVALTKSSFGQLCAEAEQLAAHAATVAQDAALADAAATAAWDRCAVAEQARDMAWREYDAAQQSAEAAQREVLAARGGGSADAGRHGEASQEGERQVHRAALAAYRRGELSVEQLQQVFELAAARHPAQQQREHEAEQKGSEWRRARHAYEHAAAVERAARQVAHVAEVAAQALAEEAAEAAAEAHQARAVIQQRTGRGSPRRRPKALRG